jgi:hypothetical protein
MPTIPKELLSREGDPYIIKNIYYLLKIYIFFNKKKHNLITTSLMLYPARRHPITK